MDIFRGMRNAIFGWSKNDYIYKVNKAIYDITNGKDGITNEEVNSFLANPIVKRAIEYLDINKETFMKKLTTPIIKSETVQSSKPEITASSSNYISQDVEEKIKAYSPLENEGTSFDNFVDNMPDWLVKELSFRFPANVEFVEGTVTDLFAQHNFHTLICFVSINLALLSFSGIILFKLIRKGQYFIMRNFSTPISKFVSYFPSNKIISLQWLGCVI